VANATSTVLEDITSTEEWVEAVPTTIQLLNQTGSYLVSSKTSKERRFILNFFVIVDTIILKLYQTA